MEPAMWALIALLGGTIFGLIFYLGSRLEALGARVDRLTERVGAFDGRVAKLEGLLQDHLNRHAS